MQMPSRGCPAHELAAEYQPFCHEGMYEFFRRARSEAPVFRLSDPDVWVVSRRADVEAVFRDPESFSAFVASAPICPIPTEVLQYLKGADYTVEPVHVNLDPPAHAHVRTIAARYLNLKTFSGYEPAIRDLVRGYIASFKDEERVDIIDRMIYELPARVVFLLLGETDVDPMKIKAWADNRLLTMFGKLGHDEMMAASRELVDFWHYAKGVVADRMQHPKDDYPSFLLERRNGDDSVLTVNQIESMIFALLLAGHETTTNATGNLLLELLSHREQWERLVADPSLIGGAVEEGLRYASSVVTWRRQAKVDVEVGGVRIPKGSILLLALGSANRDEARFEDGESFDIGRSNSRDHVSFGKGIHMCLGAPLARIEMRVIIEQLVSAFPRMRLLPGQKIDWVPTITFRGPTSLLVDLGN